MCKKVKCVDAEGKTCIKVGEVYDLVEESDEYYIILDHEGWKRWFFKTRFVHVNDFSVDII